MTRKGYFSVFALVLGMLSSPVPSAQWQLDVEAGLFNPERNRVQIPNDDQGDRFNITELGNDVFAVGRLTLGWQVADAHELQLVYAPLVYEQEGTFDRTVRFDGARFPAGEKLEARYQFSSYRLRYLYHWFDRHDWKVAVGGTLFVRDASVQLKSARTRSEDSNVGVVPLLALRATRAMGERWAAVIDTDLAFASQGRAVDLALTGQYRISERLAIAGGFRTIEGGADNDDVYSFAWFNGAVLRLSCTW